MRLALAAVAAIAALVTAPVPATTPQSFDNTTIGFSEGGSTTGLAARLDAMKSYASGSDPVLRLDLNWWAVQDCATCTPNFDALGGVVTAANAAGMRVLLILDYAPPWANGGHAGTDKWFPVSDAQWQGIVAATVARFQGQVQAYEVWNEPNFTFMGDYGDGSVAARRLRYWQLVKIAHTTVHAGCAQCVVLAGASGVGDPVSETRNDNESAQWLEWAYSNGYGADFDAVAHHPYPAFNTGRSPSRPECTTRWWSMFGPPDAACGELAAVRAVMVAHGDTAKKIWGTEYGYPSSGAGITKLTAAQVRDNLEEGVRMWHALDYTGPLFLYSYADDPSCAAGSTDFNCHFGVVDAAGTPKQPSYDSLKLALAGTELSTLATGRSLHRQSALRSGDGRFELWLQGDGNLVLYMGSTVLWAKTGLHGQRLTNQANGDLVLFDTTGKAVWTSPGTAGKGASSLNLQNDGNLVLYAGKTATWSTGTWGH